MTKKRAVPIIVAACLLAIVIVIVLVVIFSDAPLSPAEPIETDTLLPKPDAMVCYYREQEYKLTGAQCEALYGLLMQVEPNIESCAHETASVALSKASFSWELQYQYAHSYVGDAQTEISLPEETFTFDRIFMRLTNPQGNSMRLVFSSDGELCDRYTDVALNETSALRYFIETMEQFVVANLMGTSVWQATDTTPW